GYLALCGAKGKPVRQEDRLQNLGWALGLLRQFQAPQDSNKEWADICNAVFAEARSSGATVPLEDQLRLCAVLAGVDAANADAAAAYAQLLASQPDAVKPEFAWLFIRAAQEHGATTDNELDLFAHAFRDPRAGQAFFHARGWDWDDVELIFLQRWADRRPG